MADDTRDDKPFLSRWSERKRAVEAEDARAAEALEAEGSSALAAEDQAELEANRAAAEAVDLEALTDKSDYAPFFRPGVPAALKSAALHKLWRSNPVFAVLDGLNDYDLDYRWPAKGSEVVSTAWKLGRGFLTDDDKAASEQKAAAKPAEDPVARPSPPAEEERVEAAEEKAPAEAEREPEPVAGPPEDAAPQPEEAEPVKVSLARRLDIAAFAKEGGKD